LETAVASRRYRCRPSSKSGVSRRSPPVVSTNSWSPSPALSVPRRSRAPRSPDRRGLELSEPLPPPRSLDGGWRRCGSFAFRPLEYPVMFCLFLCLANLAENPPDLLYPCNQAQPDTFYKSNPDFRSICEHYLLCLENFLCYSLKSTVNHD
jgi:hypothetical protein